MVPCECGCKKLLNPIDSWGKPRRFIIGHHPHSRAKKYINHDKQTLNTNKNRFYAKVLLPDSNGCMLWTTTKKKRALFIVRSNGKRIGINAARFSYKLHFGIDPGDLYVCHHCDNPLCVAPDHLWLGTQKDNMRDMVQKNRGNTQKGSERFNSKLSEKTVLEIRERYKVVRSCKKLAKDYPVKWQTIQSIISRKTWKHI